MSASDARERAVLDSIFGSGTPPTWYQGLTTTVPNDDGSGFTEPVGNGYARVAKTNNTTNFPAAATVAGETSKKNGTKITYPDPTGPWGDIKGYGWFTASTGGTPEFVNGIDADISPKSGNTPVEFDVAQCSTTCE